MAIGWFDDLPDAKAYFTVERLVTTLWDAATDGNKTKAVINGYNRIYYDSRFTVPTYAAATAAELIELKIINGEMAYYLLLHMADEDRRKGLQAQAVLEAGVVKEVYEKDMLDDLPVPPVVLGMLLAGGWYAVIPFGMVDLDRDEDESVDTKVDAF